jgi:uncharacterized protein (DUF427 family)
VRTGLLVSTATVTHSPSRGDAQHYTVKAGDRTAEDAALRYADSPIAELRDLIRLEWDAMDGWFEEDEDVYTHPRDPYTRVDILASSRQVRVEGVVLASSTNPRVLFETGLPPRWKIAGLVAFYNEEVDLFVDNQPQQRPVTKFSRKERTTMPNESAHQTRLERILGVRWRRTPCASGPRVASCWRGGRASARWNPTSQDYGSGGETARPRRHHRRRVEHRLGRRPRVPQHLDRRAPRWEGGPRDRLLGGAVHAASMAGGADHTPGHAA